MFEYPRSHWTVNVVQPTTNLLLVKKPVIFSRSRTVPPLLRGNASITTITRLSCREHNRCRISFEERVGIEPTLTGFHPVTLPRRFVFTIHKVDLYCYLLFLYPLSYRSIKSTLVIYKVLKPMSRNFEKLFQ